MVNKKKNTTVVFSVIPVARYVKAVCSAKRMKKNQG